MKEKRIFTKRMALYLTDKGCTLLRVVGDINIPHYKNWIFVNDEKLQSAIAEYMKEKY